MSKALIFGFIPWIFYLVLSGHNLIQFELSIIGAFIAAIVFQIHELRKGFVLSWGTLIFFFFMMVGVVGLKNKWVIQYASLISNGGLSLIVLISLLIGKPFTIQYAKESVPKEKWQHPLFIRINYLLSGFWLIMFLCGFGVAFIHTRHPKISDWIIIILSYLPILFSIWVSQWFPKWYTGYYIKRHT
ncbi:MAG: hypothetical protein H0U75_08485 [Legionella sp.]|nr:hypothetical protein [Legionella sp.]